MLELATEYEIGIDCSDFDPAVVGAGVNGAHQHSVHGLEIVASSIEVGYPNLQAALQGGIDAYWAALQRMAIAMSSFSPTPLDRLRKSDFYSILDPSEKRSYSYYLGLYAAHIAARRHLGSVALIHYDSLLMEAGIPITGRRPDLVGTTLFGDIILVEAKGRSSAFDPQSLANAKEQASEIGAVIINGVAHTVSVVAACQSAFPGSGWAIRLVDPPLGDESIPLPVAPMNLVGRQVAAVQDGIQSALPDNRGEVILQIGGTNTEYRYVRTPHLGLRVGLPADQAVGEPGWRALVRPWMVQTLGPGASGDLDRWPESIPQLRKLVSNLGQGLGAVSVQSVTGEEWMLSPSGIALGAIAEVDGELT